MGSIYLVRHGQASWDSDCYDQLSDLGAQQAYCLGQHWKGKAVPPTLVAGRMRRHDQTATNFLQGAGLEASLHYHDAFNEFNHEEILYRYQPEWKDMSNMRMFLAQQDDPEAAFVEHFSAAKQRWLSGEFDDYEERFVDFRSRCNRQFMALAEELSRNSDNRDAFVFTSGGVISMICGDLLGLSDERCFTLNSRIVNSSVTRVVYRQCNRSGLIASVDFINNYSHLEPKGWQWITRR
jgi:broad specificity phosphatase PhoE